ncbi:hypothetical protein BCR34DRAFT_562861 [Clohesyomyces aquaticus]|uniref:Pentatricopeptide repeat domain-containing protein n=1 Tax=Clohesyomyces aquaticus TaxID=1231657 RepID=A0A1Y1ZRQ2_9PLEO|nr:hypothetical protein BCR34DRAFT_562861 [Clohesyomyces aquaticus]
MSKCRWRRCAFPVASWPPSQVANGFAVWSFLKNSMPTALDRLLASPPALRALRALVNARELPPRWIPSINCYRSKRLCRPYSSEAETETETPRLRIRKQRWVSLKKGAQLDLEIDRESNVNGPDPDIRREIDVADEGAKVAIWRRLLQYRERVYGLDGIRDIWLGMARRGFDLPTTDDEAAEHFWTAFLRNPDIVGPVLDHAAHLRRTSGQVYPQLYQKCMAYWLPRNPEKALHYHHLLVVKLRLRRLPLRQMARLATTRFVEKSLGAFAAIYRTSNERNMYDDMVLPLANQDRISIARHWHMLCFQRGDLPSPAVRSHPIVQLFFAESLPNHATQDIKTIVRKGVPIMEDPIVQPQKAPRPGHLFRSELPRYNEQLRRKLLGRDVEPVKFEDPFCARLFATKAFEPAAIIRGLSMVRVNEIGPLALRVMGLRTEPLGELPERFRDLREAGIAVKPSVFSLALEKFATERKFGLVRSILDSDQHPDVFEDTALQRTLLDHYLEQYDWPQAHRTLAILTLFYNDPCAESWNLLLQARIKQRNPAQIMRVLEDMRAQEIFLSRESILALRSILRRRQRGRRPVGVSSVAANFDELRFVARIYMMVMEAGIGYITPLDWREMLRRYGMLLRVREQRRLLFWLFSWYAPRDKGKLTNYPKSSFADIALFKLRQRSRDPSLYFNTPETVDQNQDSHPLRQLLSPQFQRALIIWGFKAGILPNAPYEQSLFTSVASKPHFRKRLLKKGVMKRLDWSIGLQTLVELRDAGLNVNPTLVVNVLQQQFNLLFSRGRFMKERGIYVRTKNLENRLMKRLNRKSYIEYVHQVNNIWGKPLLQGSASARVVHIRSNSVDHETSGYASRDDALQGKDLEESPSQDSDASTPPNTTEPPPPTEDDDDAEKPPHLPNTTIMHKLSQLLRQSLGCLTWRNDTVHEPPPNETDAPEYFAPSDDEFHKLNPDPTPPHLPKGRVLSPAEDEKSNAPSTSTPRSGESGLDALQRLVRAAEEHRKR